MKENDIKKNLFAAVSEMIPKDEYEKITARLSDAPKKVGIEMTVKKQNSKVINFKKIAGVAVAAAVAVAVGLFGWSYYNSNLAVASIIDIDVNPSVELATNSKDIVIEAEAVNADAAEVIGDMELQGTDVDVAVNAIIGAMVKGGYLEGQDNEILITVKNDDKSHADDLQKRIEKDVDETLRSHNVSSSIINQTIAKEDKLSEAKKFAKEQGVSVGKANFVLKLAEKDPELDAVELAKSSLKDIAGIVSNKKIDISDIADHDPDDSIWENIADSVEDVNEQVADKPEADSQSQNNGVISKKKAREIALRDAGVDESKVVFVKEKLENEKGKKVYEVEFYLDGTEYDYEIDANSGKILSSDLDIEDYNIPEDDKAESKPAKDNNAVIGKGNAKNIALDHAGVKNANAKFVKVELDNDDGKKVYEVEFKALGFEYDYEVDALSGAVLKSNKEKDDDYVAPVESKPESKPAAAEKEISKADAKKAALNHAGVKNSDAKKVKVKLDYDDGKKVYEVEFKALGFEYDYEVDALSGAVLKSDKEKDDDYVAPVESKPESKPAAAEKEISKADAKKAALNHAGVKNSDAKFVKVNLDYDDGKKVYEVEFKALGFEYDYEVDALSGAVLKSDKEKDDDYVAPVESKPVAEKEISKADAKKTALNHAGVKQADAYDLSVEYDNDDGKKVYEVEFKSGSNEYSYEINALDGSVISHEKEHDD